MEPWLSVEPTSASTRPRLAMNRSIHGPKWQQLSCFAASVLSAGVLWGSASWEGRLMQRSSVLEGEKAAVRYLVYVPSSYDAAAKAAPLLVGFHGTAGHPEQIVQIPGLLEQAERHGFVLVCPASSGWYGREFWSKKPRPLSVRSDRHVADVLERTLEELRIDEKRIYVLGVSKGGAGAWHWAFKEPGRWAGIAAISPATYSPEHDWERIAAIPSIMIQGADDRAVSVSANRRLSRTLLELGGSHRYVELPGVGHDLSKIDVAGEVFRFFVQVESKASDASGIDPGHAPADREAGPDVGIAEVRTQEPRIAGDQR